MGNALVYPDVVAFAAQRFANADVVGLRMFCVVHSLPLSRIRQNGNRLGTGGSLMSHALREKMY